MSRPPALEVHRLTVSYGSRPALWDVDASFPAGALSAIAGPNGAGKSTLLRAALGLVPADSGVSMVLGRPVRRAPDAVAFVPQASAVDWDFPVTVREVVEMGRYRRAGWLRRLREADRRAALAALEHVGMAPFASRQIGRLSGGQRQRVFLARALAQEAPVLVMDEPFAGVDARTEAALLALMRGMCHEGRSVIAVHHGLEAVRAAFDWALLLNVRAIACGPVAESLAPEAVRRAYGVAAAEAGAGREAEWVT